MNQLIGTVLGNHRILKKLGEGGMGAVYLARDLSLEREVAIKIIAPELARTPGLMARFRVEAIAQAKLNHNNIVTIHSFNEEQKMFFIVMELVEGKNLKTEIKERGILPVREALELFSQILSGVGYAHSQGIVHRDIKSSNIYLTADNTAKIGDFGIAKVEGIEGLTRMGSPMGSPVYSSPEQLLGKPVDTRTDIYSLGIVLYEMLSGVLPFRKTGSSTYLEMKHTLEIIPPPPSTLNSSVSSSLDAIVMKSIAKEMNDRFQKVSEFKSAIKQEAGIETSVPVTGDRQVSAVSDAAVIDDLPSSSQTGSRHNNVKVMVAALGVVLVVLVLFLFISPGGKSSLQSHSGQSNSPSSSLPKQNSNINQMPGIVLNNPSGNLSGPSSQPGNNPGPGVPSNNTPSPGPSSANSDPPSLTVNINVGEIVDKMSRQIRGKYYKQAVDTGTQAINNGIISAGIYQKIAQALYYNNQENRSWHYCMKIFEINGSLDFKVRYEFSKKGRVYGLLSVHRKSLSFSPNNPELNRFAFTLPASRIKKVSHDITADIKKLFKKKRNRKEPAFTIHDDRKTEYRIRLTSRDKDLRGFMKYIIETLKKKY